MTANLQLENHSDSTINPNPLIDGNWGQLEKVLGGAAALAYAATVSIPMTGERLKKVTLTGNVSFATSSRAASGVRKREVLVTGDAVDRTIAFAAGIVVVGAVPASLAAGKKALLEVWSTGANESDTIVRWTPQA